jgi:hypothetical protein
VQNAIDRLGFAVTVQSLKISYGKAVTLLGAPPPKQPDLPVLYKQTGFAEIVTLERPRQWFISSNYFMLLYRGADKSLARPGRIHTNVSVRMA